MAPHADGHSVGFPQPDSLIGTFRRFGPVGPVYEVLGKVSEAKDDIVMKVRVIDSGEEVEYLYTDILDDPLER